MMIAILYITVMNYYCNSKYLCFSGIDGSPLQCNTRKNK